jgi:hypothetical protein
MATDRAATSLRFALEGERFVQRSGLRELRSKHFRQITRGRSQSTTCRQSLLVAPKPRRLTAGIVTFREARIGPNVFWIQVRVCQAERLVHTRFEELAQRQRRALSQRNA